MQGFAANASLCVFRTTFPLTLASLDLSPRRGDENKFSLVEMSVVKFHGVTI